jgi:LacI family transcriptional regulator
MITGQTLTIGVAILDIRNPHFTNIVKGANRIALQHDYTLLLVDTEESGERERSLIESLAQRVDGMILSSRMPDDSLQWLVDLDKPVVLFGRSERFPLTSVGTDGYLAAYMLANHLVTMGHRRLAYLGFARSRWNDERIRGITSCLQKSGFAPLLEESFESSGAGPRSHGGGGPAPHPGIAISFRGYRICLSRSTRWNARSSMKASAARSIETCRARLRSGPIATARARVRQCAIHAKEFVRG